MLSCGHCCHQLLNWNCKIFILMFEA
uniref:Uncharacterized protein n=1 Tax=Rhizophora mucronata TaxID=61149 RepID=A0A2P2Q3I9_RHIMU